MIYKNLTDWKLAGFWPHVPLQGVTMETGMAILPVTPWIDAKVPGGIHKDLLEAGIIEDPYYELNSLKCEWVSQRWWIYKTEFVVDKENENKKLYLVFKGIDYKAHIYLNGKKLKEHEGMNTECRIALNEDIIRGEKNEIRVVIENAPDEMGQIGFTSGTTTQKARFGYKWDFSTRLINLGLYDEVYIETVEDSRICDAKIKYDNGKVNVEVWLDKDAEVTGSLAFEGKAVGEFKADTVNGFAKSSIEVENPKLWWPNGYGEQPLYDLKLECASAGKVSDAKEYKVGLRKIEYEQCKNSSKDSLPYVLKVNGVRMPIKGVNITPLDHIYGTVTKEHYEKIVVLAKNANVNLIRVWGGGIIEKEIFYDLCDKYGIMVWQDFIQSSSGIDNIPSKNPHFLELLKMTAEMAVKVKRNHACLAIWCGGNELMDENGNPSTFEDENIAMLKDIVERYDAETLFLPTTASGPNSWCSYEKPEDNHDIHGPWKYEGVEGTYKHYNKVRCLLLGECGNDGMSNMSALKTILSEDNLKMTTVYENPVWAHHGQTWDTYEYRDKDIFGEFTNLEEYIKISQYMQAEGLRYAIESQRRKFPETAGINIWQLNEPWPNVACTCLVDYYNNPKFAYRFVRDAYKNFRVTLEYDKLLYNPAETFSAKVCAVDDVCNEKAEISVKILNENKECIYQGNSAEISCSLEKAGKVFYVECVATKGEMTDKNVYMLFVVDKENKYADREAVIRYIDEYLKQN